MEKIVWFSLILSMLLAPVSGLHSVHAAQSKLIYGKSAMKNDLEYYKIIPGKPNGKSALLVFAIHGFEDAWEKDGLALTAIAHALNSHYSANTSLLNAWTLYIVPSANPDGSLYGKNNYREGGLRIKPAFGRCTSEHRDLNKNFTKSSFVENASLKSLVNEITPSIVFDFHGWCNGYIGNKILGDYFSEAFNANYQGKPYAGKSGYRYWYVDPNGKKIAQAAFLPGTLEKNSDYFVSWTSEKKMIPSVLIEYPGPDFDNDGSWDTEWSTGDNAFIIRTEAKDLLVSRTKVAMNNIFKYYK